MYISSCQNFSAPSLLKILCTQFFSPLAVTQLKTSLASFFFFFNSYYLLLPCPGVLCSLALASCNYVPHSCTPPVFFYLLPSPRCACLGKPPHPSLDAVACTLPPGQRRTNRCFTGRLPLHLPVFQSIFRPF